MRKKPRRPSIFPASAIPGMARFLSCPVRRAGFPARPGSLSGGCSMRLRALVAGFAAFAASGPAFAQASPPAPAFNAGDTAWMLTATALVLMMTIPGLALFYGGMVRKMNVLATVMQSFAITCLVTILWTVLGYSLAFTGGTRFIGGLSQVLLNALRIDSVNPLAKTIPESVYMTFQMTFAIITPALICGAIADRMKFSALLWFIGAWSLLVYAPIAHWVWGPGGFLGDAGVLDFAGVAGLVAALVIGKRRGYGVERFVPHNLVLSVLGASLLWVGWFGFNAGSATAANASAAMAMAVTQIATAAAALSWMFAEWIAHDKPSVLGIISGAVAGLVAITPASGFVAPGGALVIGAAAGVGCFWAATSLKNALGYDDSLDAFGVHAVGGMIGALLTGVFARAAITGDPAKAGALDGHPGQVLIQLYGIAVTALYCAVASFIILKIIDATLGLRVDREIEREGLDLALHGEAVQ